jgi:hypothetical protein
VGGENDGTAPIRYWTKFSSFLFKDCSIGFVSGNLIASVN